MIGAVPFASTPIGDPRAPAPSRPPSYKLAQTSGAYFVAAEVEVYRPGGATALVGIAFGEAPPAAPFPVAQQAADYDTLRASDLGYVSPATDPAGTLAYPSTLDTGFAVNRLLDLAPGGSGAAVSWGAARLVNADRRYDTIAATRNVNLRPIRLYMGRKSLDASRGRYVDPGRADLAELFAGLAEGWAADDTGVSIPVLDASAWLVRPVQSAVFGGTGTSDGSSNLAGVPKPKLRGAALVEPVLIDPVANVWQYNDAFGSLSQIYEDGAAVFAFGGDVANLWAGSTSPGGFRTSNANGLFQLGSIRAGRITIDATGRFPVAGAVTTAAALALYLAIEDLGLSADALDTASFLGLDAAFPYTAGWYWTGAEVEDGATAVARFLASIGARLVPARGGRLRAVALRTIAAGTVPAASYTRADIIAVQRIGLPADCSPPPYRLRWGYAHNFAPLDQFKPAVTDAQRIALGQEDAFASWSSAAVSLAYRRPSDPAPIVTALRTSAQATIVAQAMGDLWGAARLLYAVELPLALGIRHEIGDVVTIAYPLDALDAGQTGTVVGEILRAGDASTIIQVLV